MLDTTDNDCLPLKANKPAYIPLDAKIEELKRLLYQTRDNANLLNAQLDKLVTLSGEIT